MELYLLALLIIHTICKIFCIRYEMEFSNTNIFLPCEDYPNEKNFIHSHVNISNVNIEHTEDGSIDVKGYCVVKTTVNDPVPLSIEVFRKVRGTWQPTVFYLKRTDACRSMFSRTELWHSYLKNTPKEQLTCPFKENQRIDFNISEPTYIDVPFANKEGEYKIRIEGGRPNRNFYVCTNVFATLYRV